MGFDLEAFNRRVVWRSLATALSVQAAGCAIIAWVWGDDGNKWEFFLVMFAVLFLVGMVNALFGFVAKLMVGLWDNSQEFEALFLDDLRKMGVPPPASSHRRTWSYLSEVADDEDYSADQRVAAARLFADARQMLKGLPFMQHLRCEKAFDAAVMRFADESPKSARER
jgi:hypothetical protein